MRKIIRAMNLILQQLNRFFFKDFKWKSCIKKPLQIEGKKNISIGYGVFISRGAWLAAMSHTGNIPNLIIDDRTYIGHFSHIYATKRVYIGKDVLIADKVYIADNSHEYRDISIPIKSQKIIQKNEVYIGDNSWIGENVCIIGAKIGKHCIIGSNSVVTHDIPDYSVAVGSPAKIIKRYDFEKKQWEII